MPVRSIESSLAVCICLYSTHPQMQIKRNHYATMEASTVSLFCEGEIMSVMSHWLITAFFRQAACSKLLGQGANWCSTCSNCSRYEQTLTTVWMPCIGPHGIRNGRISGEDANPGHSQNLIPKWEGTSNKSDQLRGYPHHRPGENKYTTTTTTPWIWICNTFPDPQTHLEGDSSNSCLDCFCNVVLLVC